MFIVQYIVVLITIIYVIFYGYIKIKYPFWNNQPVYHKYDLWRGFWSDPFYIYKYRPIKTKFYNSINVTTIPYLDANTEQKGQVLQLLLSNYISNDRILLTMQEKNLDTSYAGHTDTPFFSVYIDKNFKVLPVDSPNGLSMDNRLFAPPGGSVGVPKEPNLESLRDSLAKRPEENLDLSKNIIVNNSVIGSLLSNPVKIYYQGSPQDKVYTELPLYYMDYLCVHRELDHNKKSRVIRELFQTHEYNQRLYNPTVLGSLFKREIDLLEGVVPLVQYTTYIYYLHNVIFPPLPAHFEIVQITGETMDLLTDFLFVQTHLDLEKSNHLTLLSVTSLGNYVETIKQNTTYIFCLKKGSFIYGMYFFKDAKMQYEDLEGNTLHFYGSVCNTDTAKLFHLGFLHSICLIIKKYREFKMMLFENLGDNTILHRMWRQKNSPTLENKTAYYTFNWIWPGSPLQPEKCLFL